MKSQVLSIEQMQTLKDKGFDISVGSMMWVCHYETLTLKDHAELMLRDEIIEQCKECMPTMTLQDILDVLPKHDSMAVLSYELSTIILPNQWILKCTNPLNLSDKDDGVVFVDHDILNVAYQMLLWCIDNGHIEVKPQRILSNNQQIFIMNKFTKVE